MTVTFNWKDSLIEVDNAVCKTLGKPKYVQMMLNEEKKLFGVKPCEIDSEQVLIMPESEVQIVDIQARSLLKKIWNLMNWDTKNPRVCVGVYLEAHHVVVFDLCEAYEVILGEAV